MSIPLDRLYDHLHNKSNHDMIIYRWLPHGSKKLTDLQPLSAQFLTDWVTAMTTPIAIMHDQEPLNFDLWSDDDFSEYWRHTVKKQNFSDHYLESEIVQYQIGLHLRGVTSPGSNLYDQVILTHSEQNSHEVLKYQQHGFLPVYYWSHALIAADWFRYAQHDCVLDYKSNNFKHDFLIYNRAWTGSREYRLTFAELLADRGLIDKCLTSFSAIDNQQWYTDHKFKNKKLSISRQNLHQLYQPNQHLSSASADYNSQDYQSCGIEIVLETLFDDTRLHLTEKTLRPIACGKPFMLAATPNSLKYLRSYGFETFGKYIDESYDSIIDPLDRLCSIVREMHRIAALPQDKKIVLLQETYAIAKRNQKKFFSESWQQSIEKELYKNLDSAIQTLKHHCTGKYWRESLARPHVSASTSKSKQDLQLLELWLQERNQALTLDPSHSASGGVCL